MAKKNCGCGQDPCVTFGAESGSDKTYGAESFDCVVCDETVYENYNDDEICNYCRNIPSQEEMKKQAMDEWYETFGEFYTTDQLDLIITERFYGYQDDEDITRELYNDINTFEQTGNEALIVQRFRNFEAPYAGSGSLFSIGGSDALSGLSSKELTESSAIHGDFDSASLNYSGHQNLQVRAETFESMSWYDPGEDTSNLERAFRREYPRYTLDSSSMEYLIYQGGASNKFHIFFVAEDDGGQYHAFNAYGRIGYNPRIQYIGGPYSTSDSAEYAFKKKMGQKTKKGYRPFGAEEGEVGISANDFMDNVLHSWTEEFIQYYTPDELSWVLEQKQNKYPPNEDLDFFMRLMYEDYLMKFKDASEDIIYEEDVGGGISPFEARAEGYGDIYAYTRIPYSWDTDSDYDEYIYEGDINERVEEEVDQEVRSGNYSGSSVYGTTVEYEDPEDKDAYIEKEIDVDYSWGAEGSEDIPQVELHNPIETGIKLSIGSMIAVVGISALGGAMLGLLNRTMGDE